MSAIFGIIKKQTALVSADEMAKMSRAIPHRAPEGSRYIVQNNAGIGFCKMVIYAAQLDEVQPYENDGFIVAADFRIDNKSRLVTILQLSREERESISDAALLLKAYQLKGLKLLDILEGEFAIAIWDKQLGKLLLATDPIGFRPLYYYDSPDAFIFCSEIKGITAIKKTPNYFNDQHISEFFYRQADPSETLNKEIFLLCGGQVLLQKNESFRITKYWRLQPSGKYHFAYPHEWTDCLRDLLYQAVEKRVKDTIHPVGITLSGGLDSTSIACLLSEILAKQNKPLYTISSVLPADYSGNKTDERYYIQLLGKHCPNIVQTFVETPAVSPFDHVGRAVDQHETFPNAFFYLDEAICSAARQHGIKLLFSGYGGDYWVSRKGNTVIYQLLLRRQLKEVLRLIGKLNAVEKIGWLRLFKREVLSHLWGFRGFSQETTDRWFSRSMIRSNYAAPTIDENAQALALINSGKIGRLTSRLSNTYAFCGIQSADPMFDKAVFELLADMPIGLFVESGYKRSVIRQAMDGVIPPEIQWRIDKKAYNPDYIAQIIDHLPAFISVLKADQHRPLFQKYFNNEQIIAAAIDNPEKKLSTSQLIRLSQIGIAQRSIRHLEEQQYLF